MNPIDIHSEQDKADDGDQKTIPESSENGGVETTAVRDVQDGGKEYSDSNFEVNRTLDPDVINDQTNDNGSGHNKYITAINAQAHLPKPEPPKPRMERSQSLSITERMPSIGKYILDRSTSFSAAIINSLYSLKEDIDDIVEKDDDSLNFDVTEFKIPGVKVIVNPKSGEERLEDQIRGRITLFTKSNCKDCIAARRFFREKGHRYVEINIDVFTKKAEELIERSGDAQVPKIFFNDCLIGGLETLKSWSESGGLEEKMRELLGPKCPEEAPKAPDYGINDEEDEEDELMEVVNYLRRSLQIQDRLIKMKMVKSCFAGADMGIATAKMIAQKHFIHHVFGENDFESGNHYYRFLEHEPFIMGCFNFRTATNDNEPKPASIMVDRLSKLMLAIVEMDGYVSDNRLHVDYLAIGKSEEFRRYIKLVRDLQRINLKLFTPNERLTFFLNLYNAMVIHAVISIGHPEGILDNKIFFLDFQYVIGGYPYSLSIIENGILRNNRRSPYSLTKPFNKGDRRLHLVPMKLNPLIHFGLCKGTRSSPKLRFFTAQNVQEELKTATMDYFQNEGIEIDSDLRTVYLTRIIKWFSADFGEKDRDILEWVLKYLDGRDAEILKKLLADEDTIAIVYQDYDWSGNL
ncbi:Phytosulfokin receptor 1 [Hibiscus syriacus]|uniref:Phytosulfokin receptor 1 n=1 Tax=Hibiscus syriacus TaxID=106335 RepID=A0A6A3B1R3_HIBSY|nr:Phytosulfokin receptor 1 [Hibiscus syriacus]